VQSFLFDRAICLCAAFHDDHDKCLYQITYYDFSTKIPFLVSALSKMCHLQVSVFMMRFAGNVAVLADLSSDSHADL